MGIFGKVFGKSKTSGIVKELQAVKAKVSELPQAYATGASIFGAGASKAREQIPTICAVIDDSIKALEKGLDVHNRHITRSQTADGLRRLVAATRRPAFIGLVSTVLNPFGIRKLTDYMNELERITNKIK